MTKYIKKFLIFLLFIIISYNFSFLNANEIDIFWNNEKQKEIKQNYNHYQTTIDGVNLNYEIWFYNTISPSNQIFDIKLNFDKKFQWKLNIYKPINYSSKQKKLYKSLKIDKKNDIFQLKSQNNLSFFIENKLWEEKELKNITFKFSDSLYLSNINNCNHSYICTDNLNYSILSLLSFQNIIVNQALNENEIQKLLEYTYKWGVIILNKDKFSTYFQDLIVNHLWKKENNKTYDYWLGYIQIWNTYDDKTSSPNFFDNWNFVPLYKKSFFLQNKVLQEIAIDDNIRWKFLDYRIILIFVCIYFIIIIPVNFIIKRKKGNKLFFVYSIPIISLIFTTILIIMNISIKWIYNIENKLEINILKDGKIYQQIYSLDFIPNGGDYQILINPDDVTKYSFTRYSYDKYKTWDIQDNKLKLNFKNIKSSQIVDFIYGRIKNRENFDFGTNYDNIYDNWEDFAKDYIKTNKDKKDYYRGDYYNYPYINPGKTESKLIKKIWVNKILDTKYSNKYSLGGEIGYKLRIDIYY